MLVFRPSESIWQFDEIKWMSGFELRRIDPETVYNFLKAEFGFDDDFGELSLYSVSTEGDVLLLDSESVDRLFFTREHAIKFLRLITVDILKEKSDIEALLLKIEELEEKEKMIPH
ncbi:hypothetical protein KJ885_01815 [Patescibacteria group bacterium]|nr:hypothetical protein [Patescibacteria group bacterium]